MFNFLKNKTLPDWSFQLTAISNIVGDFGRNPKGRFLLVLPTGGGKTLTAIRSLNEMVNKGAINGDDKVLWIVHTLSLQSHAKKNLESEKNIKKFSLNPKLKEIVDVRMKAEAIRVLQVKNNYRLIVIDEAHHAAASTYGEFFEYPLGILGLTATPHRMDAKELPFEKVSYSITFRELVRRKVVLLPKFLPEVRTGIKIEITSLGDEDQLERFNSKERNDLVAHTIFQEAEKHAFKKVVVFAGTNAHVKRLYETLLTENERLGNPFKHVGYIYGGDTNDKDLSNEKYLEWHHSQESSILVNCKILNEGYDDPNIDTVVMATPTNSILYYLQCVGRVVRNPEDNDNARAFVVEIVDQLPNVAYRIDNRWLFAEISDYLEPTIIDAKGMWPVKTIRAIAKLISLHVVLGDIPKSALLSLLFGKRVSLLLFNDVPYQGLGKWRSITMQDGDIKQIRMFNDLSENIDEYYPLNHDYLIEKKYPQESQIYPMSSRAYRSSLMAALRRAATLKANKKHVDSLIYLSMQ